MKPLPPLLLLFVSFVASAQNMVLNPSFEEHTPNTNVSGYDNFKYITHWEKSCFIDQVGFPDGFCKNQKLQDSYKLVGLTTGPEPHSGDHCAGLDLGSILVAELNGSMKKDSAYSISFYYKWNDSSTNYALHFSFYLAPENAFLTGEYRPSYKQSSNWSYEDGLTMDVDCDSCAFKGSWHKFNFTYYAKGGEKYLLFGVRVNRIINGKEICHFKSGPVRIDKNTGKVRDPAPLYYLIDDVSVVPEKSGIKVGVTMNVYDILFDVNSSVIKPGSFSYLDKLAGCLNANPIFTIEITGYTDNMGSEADNMTLSLKRAESVRDYLISHGVRPDRINVYGMGESKPITSNDTPDGRARNRRIAIIIRNKQ